MMLRLLLPVFLAWIVSIARTQPVSTLPAIPVSEDSVTIIFNAAQGNKALSGFKGTVYAHTGVITDRSANPSDWRYVQGNWGTADAKVRMKSVGNDQYRLTYHLRNFYQVPQGEKILKMAFVFRNENGSLVGRNTDGSDIFVDVAIPGSLQAAFTAPLGFQQLLVPDESLQISGSATGVDSLTLLINQRIVASQKGLGLTYTFRTAMPGAYEIVLRARAQNSYIYDTLSVYVRNPQPNIAPLPNGVQEGVNRMSDGSVVLALYAPAKQFSFVIGDLNDWKVSDENYMNLTPDGKYHWKQFKGLTPEREYRYQYWIEGKLRIADPYTEKILDPASDKFIATSTYPTLLPYPDTKTNRILSTFIPQKPAYPWKNKDFKRPAIRDLVIYELLVRDFSARSDFQGVIDSLDYLQRLGINAIELMPVMEFENNDSWGYNPSFMFALDKYYGTEEKFKELIDECHNRGIAVILDIVLNHQFGQSPLVELYFDGVNNRPLANNPWFNTNPTHPFNVGYDMNHESPDTKKFVYRVVRHWLENYRIDGYRFDLSKGFTQQNNPANVDAWSAYDASRIAIWKAIADTIRAIDASAYIILEHLGDNREEKELSDAGMLLWGNMNFNFNEATMGYHEGGKSDFSRAYYKRRDWTQPHLIAYMESHDEERLMYKNLQFGNGAGAYSVKNLPTALDRIKLAALCYFSIPGPKMIWQFGELGYDINIDFNGRTGRKPLKWEYFQDPLRRKVYDMFRLLSSLKQTYEVFGTEDAVVNVAGPGKQILLRNAERDVLVLGNFDITPLNISAQFSRTGTWYEFFSGDSIQITTNTQRLALAAGAYRLYSNKKWDRVLTPVSAISDLRSQGLLLYPNPAADSWNLQFSLSQPSYVKIDAYTLQGETVKNLFQGRLPVGTQRLSFPLDTFTPQTYILRCSIGNKVEFLIARKEN